MDPFASIGRALATPRYYFTLIIVGIVIVYVIYTLYAKPPPPGESRSKQLLVGAGIVAFALFTAYLSYRWTGMVKTNSRYASIAGFGDILRMFR